MSYAEVTKRVKAGLSLSRRRVRPEEGSVSDGESLIVKKKDFLCFMVEVINCTSQAKHRSEKTAIVVKSAARYLGIKRITCETVYDELKSLSQPLSQSPASSVHIKPEIICIVETEWLKPQLNFGLNGHICERSDRNDGSGGGCATFIKEGIPYRVLGKGEYLVFEVWCDNGRFVVVTFYNPCKRLEVNALETIEGQTNSKKIIWLGDFSAVPSRNIRAPLHA